MVTPSEFIQYCTKQSTKRTYTSALRTYLTIMEESIPQKHSSETLDQQWNTYLKSNRNIWHDLEQFPAKAKQNHLSPKTINLYVQIVILYLGECSIIAEPRQVRRIKKQCPKNHPITRDAELTRETIKNILHHADIRQRAEILMALSSGMRIGELLQLTFDDIDLTKQPTEIHIPGRITKTETPRITFISHEATKAFLEWKKNRQLPGTLRGTTRKNDTRIFPYTPSHESKKFQQLLKKSGNYQTDPITHRSCIHFHSFRKYFLTEFKMAASAEVAEELAGHAGYLSKSYRRISKQDMIHEYQKAESRLTIESSTLKNRGKEQYENLQKDLQRIYGELEQLQNTFQILCDSMADTAIDIKQK